MIKGASEIDMSKNTLFRSILTFSELDLRGQVSTRLLILLEVGTIGYFIGVASCAFLWLYILWYTYLHRFFATVAILIYPLMALGLAMAGLSCFALGILYKMQRPVKWLAITTGIFYVITSAFFFLMNSIFNYPPDIPAYLQGHLMLTGFRLLIITLLIWGVTGWRFARLANFNKLGITVLANSLIAATSTFLYLGLVGGWDPLVVTFFSSPFYFTLQIFSALLLHRIRRQQLAKRD
jgi:hypothetical protein